jgi:hypothetical protein
VSAAEPARGKAWPFRLDHDQFGELRFLDFRGGDIHDVVRCLYRDEPEFMRALEADVRERGVREPVELGHGDRITEGHHRIAAAYVAGRDVPVAFPGEDYPRDPAAAQWSQLRRDHPGEYEARMNHDPLRWDWPQLQASGGMEAGQ